MSQRCGKLPALSTANFPHFQAGEVRLISRAMETIYDRVKRRLDELGISENAASKRATGDNRDFVRNLKSGKVKVGSAANLAGLAEVLDRSVDWILYGDDEPESERKVIPIDEAEGYREPAHTPKAFSDGTLYSGSQPGAVPELDARAGAGEGTIGRVYNIRSAGIQSGHKVTAEWVVPPDMTRYYLGADPQQVVIVQVQNDSMEPTLRSGDRVMVDLTSTIPTDGGIFILDEGHGPIVKRCRLLPGTDPLSIEIISDNPLIGPRVRPVDDVRVIGQVRGRWTRI